MSSSWCMYCSLHPSQWKSIYHERTSQHVEDHELWTIDKQKRYAEKKCSKGAKRCKTKKGIVNNPLIPFIEPKNYIFPLLHFEIGMINNVLDSLRSFVQQQIEVISGKKKCARKNVIIANVSLTRLKERTDCFNESGGAIELRSLKVEIVHLNQALREAGNTADRTASLLAERQQKMERVNYYTNEQKLLKEDMDRKRKALSTAKAALKKYSRRKPS
jgi:hypothetical protein